MDGFRDSEKISPLGNKSGAGGVPALDSDFRSSAGKHVQIHAERRSGGEAAIRTHEPVKPRNKNRTLANKKNADEHVEEQKGY